MLTLKNKSQLEALPGKNVMYRATTYKITGITEIAGQYIISTDLKALRFAEADVPGFLSELMPVLDTRVSQKNTAVVLSEAMDTTLLSELTTSLMQSLRDIDSTDDPEQSKRLGKKIKLKVAVARATTDVAKTVILAQRFTR